ncbi:MAG: hypothetical protein ABI681_10780 [Gemmatimonadales bacterium]
MTEPRNQSEKPLPVYVDTTGVMPGAQRIDPLDASAIEPLPVPDVPLYRAEPLFNKRVMFVWAIAAFAVWMAVTFVVPIAVEAAKSAIVSSLETAGANTAGRGKVTITRTKNGITITRTEPIPASTAAPAPVAAPAEPAPAVTPEPAPQKKAVPPRR